MVAYKITEVCKQCGLCAEKCPFEAIVKNRDKYQITDNCEECGICIGNCPVGAIVEIVMQFENQGIKCNIFWDTQAVIEKTEAKIKEAKSTKERQYYAQDILLEVETLLACSDYNAGNPDCISCHSILQRYAQEYKYLARNRRKNVISK